MAAPAVRCSLSSVRTHPDRTPSKERRPFRHDHAQTLRGVILGGPEHYALWKYLPAMIRDGMQSAFIWEFGRMALSMPLTTRGYADVFNDAMSSYSSSQTAWALEALDAYDFSWITHLCDIRGGHGHVLCPLTLRNR